MNCWRCTKIRHHWYKRSNFCWNQIDYYRHSNVKYYVFFSFFFLRTNHGRNRNISIHEVSVGLVLNIFDSSTSWSPFNQWHNERADGDEHRIELFVVEPQSNRHCLLHRPFHLGSLDDATHYNYDAMPRGSVSTVLLSSLVVQHRRNIDLRLINRRGGSVACFSRLTFAWTRVNTRAKANMYDIWSVDRPNDPRVGNSMTSQGFSIAWSVYFAI